MKLNRIVYLGYCLMHLDQSKFMRFLRYASGQTGRSKSELMWDALMSVYRYNISLLEYFQFRFFELPDSERQTWEGPGMDSDFTKEECIIHPVTGVEIRDFQIPFLKKTLEMIKRAAAKHPQNRSIDWDMVITGQRSGLIEGNHNWCKQLWQLPVKQGLKHRLGVYLQTVPKIKSFIRSQAKQNNINYAEEGI